MLALLAIVFVVLPFIELVVIIEVGSRIGTIPTLIALVAISAGGAFLVKREGLGTLQRARTRMQTGSVPGREITDGVLIVTAGALLLTPGFVTDAVGLALLLPPSRAVIRSAVVGSAAKRITGRAGNVPRRDI